MDNEAEVIKQQMEEKRTDLTEKLEKLEQQVVDTVQSTTNAVTDTVESVKEVVQETVDTVKGSVEETVESVKQTFDLRRQVENHPWLMLGGSVAAGFVAGRLLEGLMPAPRESYYDEALPPPSSGNVPINGGGRSYRYGEEAAARREFAPPSTSEPPQKSWLTVLTQQFAPEIDKLKGMAIGAALGVVRDMVKNALPEELGGKVSEMIDDVTQKMGGEPFKSPVVSESSGQESSQRQPDGRDQPQASGSASGRSQSGVPPFNRM
jgi:ElaB/YqjD/DUF883 family membrane-anchored ribosome-binding protein